jgi:hypothetical protein
LRKNDEVRVDEHAIGQPERRLYPDKEVFVGGADEQPVQASLGDVVPDAFGRHLDQLSVDQLDALVLPHDAGLHHAADLVRREAAARVLRREGLQGDVHGCARRWASA